MCSVGLAAISAWLIARASQMPPVLDLAVAATSVRALGVGKAVFRYLNQIAASSRGAVRHGQPPLERLRFARRFTHRCRHFHSSRRSARAHRPRRGFCGGHCGASAPTRRSCPCGFDLFRGNRRFGSPLRFGVVVAGGLLISGLVGPDFAMRGARLAEKAQIND